MSRVLSKKNSSAAAEIARDADDVDLDLIDVHSALTLEFNPFNASCSKLLLFEGFSAILV